MILDGAVITNGPNKTEFIVENNVPILRQKNILSIDDADTPAKRIYFTGFELMYVDNEHLEDHHKLYWDLVKDFINALPPIPSDYRSIKRINFGIGLLQSFKNSTNTD